MSWAAACLQAAGLFLVTNIDDIIVLSLFFAQGAGTRGTTWRIAAGQYLGFGAILLASVTVALGAGLVLPESAIAYFGLIPLTLGLFAAWRAWHSDDDDPPTGQVSVLTVAAVTFANGGDNIGVYVPIFLSVGPTATIAYASVFLCLVIVLVFTARFLATRKPVATVLERWEHILFPLVLIGLGVFILIDGGAFGL